jgi:hypothetical protein
MRLVGNLQKRFRKWLLRQLIRKYQRQTSGMTIRQTTTRSRIATSTVNAPLPHPLKGGGFSSRHSYSPL